MFFLMEFYLLIDDVPRQLVAIKQDTNSYVCTWTTNRKKKLLIQIMNLKCL